ncbi:protein fan-like [Plakobranchus ocellatus]|uniref:Protein fan-like n=1 Tax=Plakobranchus ocellatus TaxID=259542 RepID=A0AAV4A895_9GAST|nr:protein fan-like [Plakobranchus ocellatus]
MCSIQEETQHVFSLIYAAVDDCLPQMCQLHRASTLPPGDQQAMLNAIMLSRQSRVKFNTSWLEDIYEKIVLETRADRITPLVTNPGRLMLTSSRLYFQPFSNIDKLPVLKLRVRDIKQLICRRFLLRQLGLEIFFRDAAPVSHLYLSFRTEEDRNLLYGEIMGLSGSVSENI